MSEAMDFHLPNEMLQHIVQTESVVPSIVLSVEPLALIDAFALLEQTLQTWSDTPVPSVSWSSSRLIHLQIPVVSVDPLLWLAQQPQAEKIFWSDREGSLSLAGVGVAKRLQGSLGSSMSQDMKQMQELLHPELVGVRFLGGMRFDSMREVSPSWEPWGSYAWTLPRFSLEESDGHMTFHCSVVLEPGAKIELVWQQICQELSSLTWVTEEHLLAPRLPVHRRIDLPERPTWCAILEDTFLRLAEGHLKKIVWARETELQLSTTPEPLAWLPKLRHPDTFLFYFQPQRDRVFLGASPERLFSRSMREISCDALAGTTSRSLHPEVDQELGEALLNSSKDRYEQKLVFDALESMLQELCETVDAEREPVLRKLRHVQHLWSPLHGRLKPGVTELELLQYLHPTPAVGGYPKHRALEMLAGREPFDRGWYAAPVGWIGPHGSDFAVAIRSALVHEKQVFLYTGAGIIPDSQSLLEWQELEEKLKTFLGFFAMPSS